MVDVELLFARVIGPDEDQGTHAAGDVGDVGDVGVVVPCEREVVDGDPSTVGDLPNDLGGVIGGWGFFGVGAGLVDGEVGHVGWKGVVVNCKSIPRTAANGHFLCFVGELYDGFKWICGIFVPLEIF